VHEKKTSDPENEQTFATVLLRGTAFDGGSSMMGRVNRTLNVAWRLREVFDVILVLRVEIQKNKVR